MNKKHIVRYKKGMESRTDWDRIRSMTDDDIDYSDCPPLDDEFFAKAILVWPPPKTAVGIRFDSDVLEWFKKQGPGYQSRMNAVLRTYMEAQKRLASLRRKRRKVVG